VWIDDAACVEAARAYCRRAKPGGEDHVAFRPPPIFDDFLEEEIAGLFQPRVRLPSGGWITIEPTEALTAIDVNSGGLALSSSGLEETGLTTDLEAAREIGRQLRLRAIGGLIVIDFIHLTRADHAAKVLDVLERSLAEDGVPVQISPMTAFGIVAVTRKRTTLPLARQQTMPERAVLELLRRMEREARANPGRALVARAAPQVTGWLDQHGDEVRAALARRGAGRLSWDADPGKQIDRFDVRTV
jgi:ribonuclease G